MTTTPRRRYPNSKPAPPRVAPTVKRFLTCQEREILVLVANGYTNARIAKELLRPTSLETVKSNLSRIYAALGVRSREHAVATALRWHMIRIEDIELPATGDSSWEQKPTTEKRSKI